MDRPGRLRRWFGPRGLEIAVKWHDIGEQPCSIARTVSVVGDRWTLLILRDCFLGVRRFEEFQSRLEISKAIVSDRLRKLVAEGVLARREYSDRPRRFEYRLTEKGRDLYPILISMIAWGNRHMAGEAGAPVLHYHRTCNHEFTATATCSCCGEALDPREVEVRPGPGFRDPRTRRETA